MAGIRLLEYVLPIEHFNDIDKELTLTKLVQALLREVIHQRNESPGTSFSKQDWLDGLLKRTSIT